MGPDLPALTILTVLIVDFGVLVELMLYAEVELQEQEG